MQSTERMLCSAHNHTPKITSSAIKTYKTMTTTMSKVLPDDIVIDILSRLPVKTLIKFRCVCKSWYATITHPSFITTHLGRASSYGLIWISVNAARLETPLDFLPKFMTSIGTINGLICLYDMYGCYFGSTIVLWNPSIRKIKTLPSSSMESQLSDLNYFDLFGFGFHRRTNDYKVVRIFYFRDANGTYIANPPPQIEVYTLSTDSWRRIKAVVPCFPYDQPSSAFINGSVHWVTSRWVADGHSVVIMSFDVGGEVFREMMLPNYYLDGFGMAHLTLAVLKESLSLLACFPKNGRCYIWVMREYGVAESWTKQFAIKLPHEKVERCLGFAKSDELLLETRDSDLVSYDLESLQMKYLGISGSGCASNAISFVESLVSPEGGNALLGQENSFDGINSEGICLEKRKSRKAKRRKNKKHQV